MNWQWKEMVDGHMKGLLCQSGYCNMSWKIALVV